MLASLRSITRSLASADPEVKAATYADLDISVTYHADGRAVLESRPRVDWVAGVGDGGATHTPSTRDPWQAWLVAA
jgi:hypothetical protein